MSIKKQATETVISDKTLKAIIKKAYNWHPDNLVDYADDYFSDTLYDFESGIKNKSLPSQEHLAELILQHFQSIAYKQAAKDIAAEFVSVFGRHTKQWSDEAQEEKAQKAKREKSIKFISDFLSKKTNGKEWDKVKEHLANAGW